ncbi:hypothetical protein Tco_0088234 [Tanacetum coccineum]
MSNTNTSLQTQTSNALHNAIMEAGGKDHPPMLAPGNYVQWKSRIKRYIDTKPNNELIHYCLQNPPYKFKWTEKTVLVAEGIDNDIYSTVDACPNACEMCKAIERFYKMMNELVRNQCNVTNHQVNVQFLLQLQPEWKRTSSNTSRANQDNSPRINTGIGYDNQRTFNVAGARENVEVTPDAADNTGPIFDIEPLHKEEYSGSRNEKARKRKKVFNWETVKYGKIWYDEDIHDLRSVETEFPVVDLNDGLSSEKTLSCEPTVCSLNDEINFIILFDDFDDDDHTVIFDKNSFSYKIISGNNLKTDSENDNEKVNLPSFPSPEPTVSCIDDLYFFKDFENEFPAIVYNNAQTSKSDLLTELILSPIHIDEFDLNDETSLSEYDEEE